MKLIIAKDYEELSRQAAALIAAQVIQKPACVLGLATGSSPIGTYQKLIKWHKSGLVDFSAVSTANLDEYEGLSGEHPQSYAYFMRENLFDHVNIRPEATNIPGADYDSYDTLVDSMGGIDLQLLGIGHNGHIGFNEPADSFSVLTHREELTATTIEANARFFADDEAQPNSAFTMGIGTIMKARKIVLVANGSGKAEIIKAMVQGPVTPQVPASVLQLHPDVTVVIDEAAAGLL